MSEELLVTTEGTVRTLTLNRPESRNGLTFSLNETLIARLRESAADPAVRCVILTGAGGSFCSGADLKSSAQTVGDPTRGMDQIMRTYFHGLIRAVRAVSVPTIAAIDGAAVGFGCDLALACDLRVCSDTAKLGEIFVRRGLIPDGGGTYHLPRLVGLARALELMLTGATVGAEEALRIGLVNRVVPAAELAAETRRLAETIAAGPPLALSHIKRLVYGALDGDLDQALEGEVGAQVECLRSRDFLEGVTAFFQKRAPVFKGE
jgi:enoyl-CoA hydratase/carnithine racemase